MSCAAAVEGRRRRPPERGTHREPGELNRQPASGYHWRADSRAAAGSRGSVPMSHLVKTSKRIRYETSPVGGGVTDPEVFFNRRAILRALGSAALVGPYTLACGSEADDAVSAAAVVAEAESRPAHGLVAPDTAAVLAAQEGVTVIDVRTPEEYDAGHLADADRLIDFYDAGFADAIAELDRDGEYLVYCRSGNRSGQTAALMEQLGFDQVWDLDGGVNAWSADGLALVTP